MAALSSSLLAAALAGCVPPPPKAPAAAPAAPRPAPSRPAPIPPPPAATSDWRDAPLTPGDWTYAANAAGSTASFGGVFSMSCDLRSRTVTLARAAAQRSTPVSIGVTTSNASRTLPATSTASAIVASVPARDPLLDAMAFSKGRFVIAAGGEATLYVPSWTEVTRVVEDCR